MSNRRRHSVTGSLSSAEREERVLETLTAEGRVHISDLADLLVVSEMTVRRDLDRLARHGRLRRVRGGAVAVGPASFAQRYARQSAEKEVIADKLVDLVGDGDAIAMDASTTIQRLAYRLGKISNLTVLTNGPDTFFALQEPEGVIVVLTGGTLDKRTGGLVGPIAVRSTKELVIHRAFVSATALDARIGSTEQTLADAEVKLALIEASASVVLAVDHTKLASRATARCLVMERVDYLATDLEPNDERLDEFRDNCQVL